MTDDDTALRELAERQGIQIRHKDAFGKQVEVSGETLQKLLRALGCPASTPAEIERALHGRAAPPAAGRGGRQRCFTMADLGRDRLWGLTVQLYGLTSARNWGIGDFTDLAELAETMAGFGAAAIGINPLHALFPAEPGHCSPYSPSSRQFLNPLYVDLEALPEWREVAPTLLDDVHFAETLKAVRSADLIDYPAVAGLKRRAFEAVFRAFEASELQRSTPRGKAFLAFVEQGGLAVARFACFEALHEHAQEKDLGWSWRSWPDGLGDPASDAVRRFAEEHADRIRFSQFQQWVADEQLGRTQARALAAGMPLGLYRDLAVAVDPAGAAAWSHQQAIAGGVAVGAPPDQFNPLGQNWGLAPFSPAGLLAEEFDPLRADIDANMRHAGALRIDHVMGLMRLFWIPEGAAPEDGAYVTYPLDRLLAVVGEESTARRCLVIGEDLGTVAPGFRRKMAAAGLMSYRLFYFERSRAGGLKAPKHYPENALVSVSTTISRPFGASP
jgi:4-alpha-glucanotransferase